MLIHCADGQTAFWLTLNRETQTYVSITQLSDGDVEMIEKFGEPWVNFLKAAGNRDNINVPAGLQHLFNAVL